MEIKINIPKNDYVQPTEVRQEVVQFICEYMLKSEEIRTYDKHGNSLYIATRNDGHRFIAYEAWCDQWKYVRIHGIEMQAAFKALLEAGYYIYGEYCITDGRHTYGCSKTPYCKGSECRVTEFKLFID